MLINKNRTEAENLIDHLNQLIRPSDPPIGYSDVTFSTPRVIPGEDLSLIPDDHPNDSYIYNTQITVIPAPQYTWEHPTTVEYRRVDLHKQWSMWTKEEEGKSDNPVLYTIPDDRTSTREEEKEAVLDYLLNRLTFLRRASLKVTGGFTTPTSNTGAREAVFTIVPIDHSLLYIGSLYIKAKRTTASTIPPSKTPLPDIFNESDPDGDGRKLNESDGFDYDETI